MTPPAQMRWLGMTARVWQRHASGWSVWTRFATLPFLLAAIWSHVWIGTAGAVTAVAAVAVWLWLNPRLFPPPRRTDRWHVRATFGERVWLNRMAVPIPPAEARAALALSLVTGAGFLAAVWGAAETNLLTTATGLVVTYVGKLAFLDRMVRLYETMKTAHPLYKAWSQVPVNDNRRGGTRR
ncbi:hypothetical protein SL003B_2663 [Polymorphum gilvum SL003B-26A1]|uniref:Transmembrane protein n=1 Tax=Polymorphum gilvum (strain LMG 25793 / CGMCC 1.9160 / SL003B-26A1) TaxID=991905 RepID=F2J4E4_POLGS|nr:hypothetical protein SL003B_2663 [Polymorphum gilvum SL003B-26A1]